MHRPILSLPPRTILGRRHDGRPIYNIAGAEDPPAEPPKADPAPATDPPVTDKGFPDGTPVAEMTDPQQVAYWRHQSRKHEQRAESRKDYDELKTKAAEADRLRQERETEAEKAIREAREQGRKDALAESAPGLVAAEFRGALAGRLTDEQRDALIEDINPGRYLKDDGTVDIAKVRERANILAPATGTGAAGQWPAMGQGQRQGSHGDGRRGGGSVAQVMADRAAAREAKNR